MKKYLIVSIWVLCWGSIVILFFAFHCINKALIFVEDSLRETLVLVEDWAQDKLDKV